MSGNLGRDVVSSRRYGIHSWRNRLGLWWTAGSCKDLICKSPCDTLVCYLLAGGRWRSLVGGEIKLVPRVVKQREMVNWGKPRREFVSRRYRFRRVKGGKGITRGHTSRRSDWLCLLCLLCRHRPTSSHRHHFRDFLHLFYRRRPHNTNSRSLFCRLLGYGNLILRSGRLGCASRIYL